MRRRFLFAKVILFFTLAVLYAACKKVVPSYPETPVLTYNKTTIYANNGKDSVIDISMNYTDGDGDIGLEPSDTFAPFNFGSSYFYNLHVSYWSIEDGTAKQILIPLTTDTINFNDRIKNLTPTGKQKAISGNLTLHMNATPYPGIKPDSVYFIIRLFDRKLHVSNVIQTPVLKLNL